MFRSIYIRTVLISVFTLSYMLSMAADELKTDTLRGPLGSGAALRVVDDKFQNGLDNIIDWNKVINRSVKNVVSLEMLYEDAAQQPSSAFTLQVSVKVEYFSTPNLLDTIKKFYDLEVQYDPGLGVEYRYKDMATFENGFDVTVTVTSVTCPEYNDSIPSFFVLRNSIYVSRTYEFSPEEPIKINVNKAPSTSDPGMAFTWDMVLGAEEYDIEWVMYDSTSRFRDTILNMISNVSAVSEVDRNRLFRHNSTRATVSANDYTLNVIGTHDYLLLRIRQIHYDSTGNRLTGRWNYVQDTNGPDEAAVWNISELWHEPGLNWTYTATYAEEGLKKEVVSYFDGAGKERQIVTHDNSNEVAIVAESIYDQFGRPVGNILPAPTTQHIFQYFRGFNKSGAAGNRTYDYRSLNLSVENCDPSPDSLSSLSGAGLYYSPNNPFLAAFPHELHHQYIPRSEGYPLSITKYTNDNTGRISVQGGVGLKFQPGSDSGRVTRFSYGVPSQRELDILFGNDVGYASHYLKQMVVDPNGQVSISYTNASGNTIATALAGNVPENLDTVNATGYSEIKTFELINSTGFVYDAAEMAIKAHSTYLSTIPGNTAVFDYSIEKLIHIFRDQPGSICSNCYYDLSVAVYDECGTRVDTMQTMISIGSIEANCADTGVVLGQFTVPLNNIGEYHLYVKLALSNPVIEQQTDHYISVRQDNGSLKKVGDFVMEELEKISFEECFTECYTCFEKLGTVESFRDTIRGMILMAGFDHTGYEAMIDTIITHKYNDLYALCQAASLECGVSDCDGYREQMLKDVSPYGQYGLFETLYNNIDTFLVLEPSINVIYQHYMTAFANNPDTLMIGDAVYYSGTPDFTLELLVKNWRPRFAEYFLIYHPESCKLSFCESSSADKRWDDYVQNAVHTIAGISTIPKTSGLEYSTTNFGWLVNNDPFMIKAPSHLRDSLINDLQRFSEAVLGIPDSVLPVKNIYEYIDYQLYCAGETLPDSALIRASWLSCSVDAGCRIPDREWNLYKQFYFRAKEKYYSIVRDEYTCAAECVIGAPVNPLCYSPEDFHVEDTEQSCEDTTKRSVKVVSRNGMLADSVTVTLYIPDEYGAGMLHQVEFQAGTDEAEICISRLVPASMIFVVSAECHRVPLIENCIFGPSGSISLPSSYIAYGDTLFKKTDSLSTGFHEQIIHIIPGTETEIVPDGAFHTHDDIVKQFYGCYTIIHNARIYTYNNVWVAHLNNYPCEDNVLEINSQWTELSGGRVLQKDSIVGGAYYRRTYHIIDGDINNPPADNSFCQNGTVLSKVFYECLTVKDVSANPNTFKYYQNVWLAECRRDICDDAVPVVLNYKLDDFTYWHNDTIYLIKNSTNYNTGKCTTTNSGYENCLVVEVGSNRYVYTNSKLVPCTSCTAQGTDYTYNATGQMSHWGYEITGDSLIYITENTDPGYAPTGYCDNATYQWFACLRVIYNSNTYYYYGATVTKCPPQGCASQVPNVTYLGSNTFTDGSFTYTVIPSHLYTGPEPYCSEEWADVGIYDCIRFVTSSQNYDYENVHVIMCYDGFAMRMTNKPRLADRVITVSRDLPPQPQSRQTLYNQPVQEAIGEQEYTYHFIQPLFFQSVSIIATGCDSVEVSVSDSVLYHNGSLLITENDAGCLYPSGCSAVNLNFTLDIPYICLEEKLYLVFRRTDDLQYCYLVSWDGSPNISLDLPLPGGSWDVTVYGFSCESSCNPLLAYKKPVFRRYELPSLSGSDAILRQKAEADQNAAQFVQSSCESYVDAWLKNMSACLANYSQPTIDLLVERLIAVCKNGATADNLYGATGVRPGFPTTYSDTSFVQVLQSVLGLGSFNALCNPWLLEQPYPYDRPKLNVDRYILNADSTLCAAIDSLQEDLISESYSGSFHAYLTDRFGPAYQYDSAQLNVLIASCSNCNYLLQHSLPYPAFAAANEAGSCIDQTAYAAAIAALELALPDLDSSHANYPVILQTFMNHRFGFSLTHDQYIDYGNELLIHPDAYLCERSKIVAIPEDRYSCIQSIVYKAISDARRAYDTYIAIERMRFREQYIGICANNTNSVDITVEEHTKHFTLYYYDVAGQLIRTVPPEGVRLLSDSEIEQVQLYRNSNTGCEVSVPATASWQTASDALTAAIDHRQAIAFEYWIDLHAANERAFSLFSDDRTHYWRGIWDGGQFYLEWYHTVFHPSSGTIDASLYRRWAFAAPMESDSLLHLVIQSTDWGTDSGQVFMNGVEVGTVSHVASYPVGLDTPDIHTSLLALRHLRSYNRLLMPGEARANYYQQCRVPAGMLGKSSSTLVTWLQPLSLEYGPTARRKGNQGSIRISHPLIVPGESLVTSVSNDFTIDFWVQVQDSSAVYPQDNSSSYAPDHRVYAIYPDTLSTLAAGLGVAVGTNNISVVERYGSVNPSVLSYTITDPSEYLAGWNHITIVYSNKTPYLYVNGHFKQAGVPSLRSVVHPSYNLVQQTREHALALDELRIWSRELLQEEITSIVQRDTLNSFRLGSLELYMPFTGSDDGVVQDHSGHGYHYRLPVSATAQIEQEELLALSNYQKPLTPVVSGKTPRHRLLTSYAYNSLGQVSYQLTPDAGRSEYWYDELGRLVYSQNAQQGQVEQDSMSLSYTKYEPVLGRIIEVGKLTLSDTSGLGRFMHQDTIALLHSRGRRSEITQTLYDDVAALGYEFESSLGQQHLRNRVSASVYRLYDTTTTEGIEAVQYYSYDVSGNVQTQWNYLEGLGLKRMDYEYDEQSGKVNLLKYQHGEADAFYYRYRYDGEHRLLSVESGNWLLPYSSRIIEGTTEAQYRYYLHGPLARMELGQHSVQGVDYAYTLQGWLKGVNGQRLNVNWDMGADGKSGSVHAVFGRDVLGYSLGYYQGDYVSLVGAGGSNAFRMTLQVDTTTANASVYGVGADLYNGNISNMMLSIRGARSNLPYIQGYKYDQLNRLKRVRTTFNSNPGITEWSLNSSYYRNWEDFSYDGNGNIVSVQRYPNTTSLMDHQTYHYPTATDPVTQEPYLLNNRLRHVTDVISSNVSSRDIDNQSADNYSYDAIGNLVGDASEGLTVRWNVYGKIAAITKVSGGNQHIGYGYDGSGSRVRKTVTSGGNTTHTYYVKDGSGNVLGVYEKRSDSILWKEQHLYGSSRLGIWYPDTAVSEENRLKLNGLIGRRHYELSNHLGNVMAVISDKKVVQADQSFYPEMIDVYDYYAFGGLRDVPKIDSILAGSRGYRYGFNGKENDNEVKGNGNQQDYGMRIYDPRLGRFLSVDPLIHEYSELTPYQFASNRPIVAIDLDGLEAKDLYRELDPVREQRRLESAFGIVHKETKGQKTLGIFVQSSLGVIGFLPLVVELPKLALTTSSRLFWWAAANSQTASGVAFSILVAASGYDGPDLPGPADDFGRMGRKVYDKLVSAGIKSDDVLAQAARNSYNAIVSTIDHEIKDLKTWKEKALRAFEIRNKAKDFAREMSGPNNKLKAEAKSAADHGSSKGPSFDDLFKKHKDAGLSDEESYKNIINSSKRTNEEINKKYGSN